MMFWINFTLVLFFSILVLSCLDLRGRVSRLLGVFVVGYAEIVLVEELAGLFNALTRPVVMILFILFALTAFIAWKKLGKQNSGWWQGWNLTVSSAQEMLQWLKAFPEIVLLAIGVCLLYLFGAGRIMVVPPNNSDSMTYHLSRVGYWMQYGSYYPWATANIRQTVFPMNVELGFLWTILGWGTDQLSPFVQWTSAFVVVLSIYGVVRLMGYSRAASATVGLLFLTLTQPLLQSTTTQNDLTTAALWSSVTFFYFLGMKDGRKDDFILSAIAFGLSLGAKSTSLIILPVWGIFVLMTYFWGKRRMRVRIRQWVIVAAVSTLLLGSYIYLQNYIAYGSLLGPPDNTERVTGENGAGVIFRLELLRDNSARYFYQLVDFSPLPNSMADPLNNVKQEVFGFVFDLLHLPVDNAATYAAGREPFQLIYFNKVNEDYSWFGPLMIFQMIALMGMAITWRKNREWWLRLAPLMFFGGFLVLHSAAQLWTVAKGRYYILPVALSFPAFAYVLSFKWGKVERFARMFMIVVGLLSAYIVVVGKWDRRMTSELLSLHRRAPAWENIVAYKYVSRSIPNGSIGLIANYGNFRDYPLFGSKFTHEVNRFPTENNKLHYLPGNSWDDYLQRFQESDYIFLSQEKGRAGIDTVPEDFHVILEAGPYSVWTESERFPLLNSCESPQWPLSELFRIDQQLRCLVWAQFPLLSTTSNGFFLANNPGANFQVHLFSLEERSVAITLRVSPIRDDMVYDMDVRFLQNGDEYYSRRMVVDGMSLKLDVDLSQGDTLLDLRLVIPARLQDADNPVPLVKINGIELNMP
jgi:hypothetical protein